MRDRASELRAIADGRLMLNVRNGVTVSRSMLAMIADEIDALRAAPLTPAEVGRLVERLNIQAGVMEMGERIAWGSDTALMREAAAALASERATHAETKRALEEALKALEWYGEQARLARLIHSEGDKGRHALAADGGKLARRVLEGGEANG